MRRYRALWAVALVLAAVGALGAAACAGQKAPTRASVPRSRTASSSSDVTGPARTETSSPSPVSVPLVFAIIGDFGTGDSNEAKVASLVASWDPAFVITTGDDYYNTAGGSGAGTYGSSVGRFYGRWLGAETPLTGSGHPVGASPVNAFFPVLGNHDYTDADPGPQTYLAYFALPGSGISNTSGNERYYDFVRGPAHFFALNSNPEEPDGVSQRSKQALWLKRELCRSTSAFDVVYDHHPPYSSDDRHGSSAWMQWPFAAWGASAVLSGHAHTYERLVRDGIPYFVNGLGGAVRYGFASPVPGSEQRYGSNWGAQRVSVTSSTMSFDFYDVTGKLVDRYTVDAK